MHITLTPGEFDKVVTAIEAVKILRTHNPYAFELFIKAAFGEEQQIREIEQKLAPLQKYIIDKQSDNKEKIRKKSKPGSPKKESHFTKVKNATEASVSLFKEVDGLSGLNFNQTTQTCHNDIMKMLRSYLEINNCYDGTEYVLNEFLQNMCPVTDDNSKEQLVFNKKQSRLQLNRMTSIILKDKVYEKSE